MPHPLVRRPKQWTLQHRMADQKGFQGQKDFSSPSSDLDSSTIYSCPTEATTHGDPSSSSAPVFAFPHHESTAGGGIPKRTPNPAPVSTHTKDNQRHEPMNNGSSGPLHQANEVSTHINEEPVNIHAGSKDFRQETKTVSNETEMVPNASDRTPLLRDAGSIRNRNTRWQRWRQCILYMYPIVLCVIIAIILATTISLLLKASTSSSTQVFAGDVVLISSVKRFWYNQAKIQQQPPDGVEQAEATIYVENCDSKERFNETSFSSRPLPYAFPQGLYNLQQQYLLAGSSLALNLTTYPPTSSDVSAKVCQFSNAGEFDELLSAITKEEVDEAERKGYCQMIEPPSNTSLQTTRMKFSIHSHGYYYYALAIVPGEDINITYTYTLGKRYYDKNELNPHNCSVVDQECIINGFIKVAAENCILTFIPTPAAIEPPIPYTFHSEQTNAWGIAIAFFCVALGIVVFCCVVSCYV